MSAGPRRSLRVVILDDEPAARMLLKRFLTRHGYETVETATVDAAVDALRHGPIDAVILDVRLPEERNGLDVLRLLRREAPLARVPVVILTGSLLSEEEEIEVTRHRGFLFHKPESLEALMNFLDQLTGTDQPR
jgi:DNA-binding response OmpR family regulator